MLFVSSFFLGSIVSTVQGRKTNQLRRRSLGNYNSNYNSANYNGNNNQYSSYYAATSNTQDDAVMLDDTIANDDAQQADWQYGSNQGEANNNYVWARDDDDDYYTSTDDTYGYWYSNQNLKAQANYDDDHYSAGGNYVQHDDRTYNDAGFGNDDAVYRGYNNYGDDDGEQSSSNGNDSESVGLGLLTEGQRVALAIALSVGMIVLLSFALFGPLIMSSLYHCCCCGRQSHKRKNKDLAASLAELGDF